jgi:hypothetical protein
MTKTNSKIGKSYLTEEFNSGRKIVIREMTQKEVEKHYKRNR